MIALGLIGLLVAYVGLWSGFTGTDPRDEILSAFRGGPRPAPKLKVVEEDASGSVAPSTSSAPRGVSEAVRK